MRRTIRFIATVFEWAIFTFLGIVILLIISPQLPIKQFASSYIVTSGSMEPFIPVGSLVFTQPVTFPALATGDVIAFTSPQNPKTTVLHRITEINQAMQTLTTKGDNNDSSDTWVVSQSAIRGKYVTVIPYVGYAAQLTRTKLGFVLLICLPALYFAFLQMKLIKEGIDEELTKRTKKILQTSAASSVKIVVFWLAAGWLCLRVTLPGIQAQFSAQATISQLSISIAEVFPSSTPSPSGSPVPSSAPHVVINEVYYLVDALHGGNSTKKIQIEIVDNGEGSENTVFYESEEHCSTQQENTTDIEMDLDLEANTGNNEISDNTGSASAIYTGTASSSASITVQGGNNTSQNACQNQGTDHQWIELYNPTETTINLKNWTITDNSGKLVKIHGKKLLGSHEFALLSRSSFTWKHWDEPKETLKIVLGKKIGDGLDAGGDRIFLKDPTGKIVDAVSYGSDTSVFLLPGLLAGQSYEREPDGTDTDTVFEWQPKLIPQPGM